jgi:hypothetical protein
MKKRNRNEEYVDLEALILPFIVDILQYKHPCEVGEPKGCPHTWFQYLSKNTFVTYLSMNENSIHCVCSSYIVRRRSPFSR